MPKSQLFRTILCPVDFSEHSRQALAYAAALASRNLRTSYRHLRRGPAARRRRRRHLRRKVGDRTKGAMALRRLVENAIKPYGLPIESVTLDIAVGRPHEQDLMDGGAARVRSHRHGIAWIDRREPHDARDRPLIGYCGALPFRYLAIPPVKGHVRGPSKAWPGKWALAPVDLGPRDRTDALAAAVVARELGTKLLLVHVVEPVAEVPWLEVDAARRNQQRERRALVAPNAPERRPRMGRGRLHRWSQESPQSPSRRWPRTATSGSS